MVRFIKFVAQKGRKDLLWKNKRKSTWPCFNVMLELLSGCFFNISAHRNRFYQGSVGYYCVFSSHLISRSKALFVSFSSLCFCRFSLKNCWTDILCRFPLSWWLLAGLVSAIQHLQYLHQNRFWDTQYSVIVRLKIIKFLKTKFGFFF